MQTSILCLLFFFFNDTATTEIYTLSLHDALPIWRGADASPGPGPAGARPPLSRRGSRAGRAPEARRGIRFEDRAARGARRIRSEGGPPAVPDPGRRADRPSACPHGARGDAGDARDAVPPAPAGPGRRAA